MTNPMPNYRFLLAAGALMLCIAGLARAQTTRPDRGAAEPPVFQRMQERLADLNLSDDQKVQFQALKDEVAETMRGMAPQLKDLSPEDRRAKVRASLGDVREKMMSILTPEQKQKLQAGGPLAQQTPGATTRPGGRETPMISRMRQAVLALGLTPEQTTQVNTIFDDAAARAIELRQQAAGNKGDKSERKDMRAQIQDLNKKIHEKLAAVLTPDQQAKLKETMPAGGGRGGRGKAGLGKAGKPGAEKGGEKADAPATQPAADAGAMTGSMTGTADDGMMTTPPTGTTAAKAAGVSSQANTPAASKSDAKSAAAKPVAVGSPAPAFTATRLSGTEATNKSFTGKPLVLAFGSLTSPSFRDRLPKLEAVKKKYNGRANVIVVYSREAHPADGWQVDRNRDDKVEINSPTTMKDRLALAAKLKDLSKTSVDIVVDDMNDATLAAFGNTSEGAVVISPMGTVVGTQTYCDPSGLPHLIDDALKAKS